MIVGSLIKNPGGGLAPIGGYIVGRKDCIERASYRLSAPGLGKEVGASLGLNQQLYQGLFLSPVVVSGALKAPYSRPIFMSAWATAWCQTAVNPVTTSSRPSPSARRRASYPSAREYRQPRLWTAM